MYVELIKTKIYCLLHVYSASNYTLANIQRIQEIRTVALKDAVQLFSCLLTQL